jgi:chromosomal replication initiation ATPase DnaA
MNLRWLLEKVAGHFGVDTESLESGSKVPTIAKARAVLCYLGLTSVSIATELGISQSAVSRAIARAPEVLQHEEINGEWLEYQ